MQPNTNWLIWLSSAGYGVLMALALAGFARIGSGLIGSPLGQDMVNLIFCLNCLVLVPITTYLRIGRLFLKPTSS